jgi:hypothetical protein
MKRGAIRGQLTGKVAPAYNYTSFHRATMLQALQPARVGDAGRLVAGRIVSVGRHQGCKGRVRLGRLRDLDDVVLEIVGIDIADAAALGRGRQHQPVLAVVLVARNVDQAVLLRRVVEHIADAVIEHPGVHDDLAARGLVGDVAIARRVESGRQPRLVLATPCFARSNPWLMQERTSSRSFQENVRAFSRQRTNAADACSHCSHSNAANPV